MKFLARLFAPLLLFIATASAQKLTRVWTPLLTPDLKNFTIFMGVPHRSLTSLPGVDKGDGINGTPLGPDNDPLHVFTVEMVDGK
ncbi:MAG TPA: hypothetical protein VL490_12520, partial [Mucilaginibacter sp.]|nr:hypothetical protein [Mucilaginibacter sp.]